MVGRGKGLKCHVDEDKDRAKGEARVTATLLEWQILLLHPLSQLLPFYFDLGLIKMTSSGEAH